MLNNITYDLLLFLLIISLSQLWSLLSLSWIKKVDSIDYLFVFTLIEQRDFDFSYYFLWTYYLFIYICNVTFDFSYSTIFVNTMTFFYFCVKLNTFIYSDMFVNNNTVLSINLSTLIKCPLFTYKPVVTNCI